LGIFFVLGEMGKSVNSPHLSNPITGLHMVTMMVAPKAGLHGLLGRKITLLVPNNVV